MLTPQFASNSRLKTVKACLRKYYFNYERKLVKSGKAIPMNFGSCWHSAMDSLWASICWEKNYNRNSVIEKAFAIWKVEWAKLGRPVDIPLEVIKLYEPRTPGTAKEMLYNYFDQKLSWLQSIELIAIEQPFAVPLDPDNPTRFYIGYFDKVYKIEDKLYVKEHKTTTMYSIAEGVQSRYINSFDFDSQIDGYSLGLKLRYIDSPETKMGVEVDIALVHKKQHDIFVTKTVNKLTVYDKSWLEDTIFWWDFMDMAMANKKFPKNDSSCQDQFGTCPYSDICQYTPDIFAKNDAYYENFPGYEISTYESFPYEEVKEAIMKTITNNGE